MMKLAAIIIKELKLLARDRSGIMLLFVMPAFLVITITLIQEKVTTTNVDILLVDEDRGDIAVEIRALFSDLDSIRIVEQVNGTTLTQESAHQLVAKGTYQFAVVLPEKLTEKVKTAAYANVSEHLSGHSENREQQLVPDILVWFDPTVHGSFRAAVKTGLQQVIFTVQTRLFITETLTLLPFKSGQIQPLAITGSRDLLPQVYSSDMLIPVREQFSSAMGFIIQPTAVQQNVPAWSIFGIFFICVPLAGSIIMERRTGTFVRLRTMPVSPATLLCGKLVAYAVVCCIQFAIIIAAGVYVLPCFGLPAFDSGQNAGLLALVLLGVVVAACGYGVMLGGLGRTYEQIAVFAPVSVVIAAAIGGIMVPVYAMPSFMRPLSVLSPLYWGQSAFYDVLLRGGGIFSVLPETGALFLFGLVAMVAGIFWLSRNSHI